GVPHADEKIDVDSGKASKNTKSKRGRKKTKETEDQDQLTGGLDNMEDVQETVVSKNENGERARKKMKVSGPEEDSTPAENVDTAVLGEVEGEDNGSVEEEADLSNKKPGRELIEDKENKSAQSTGPAAAKPTTTNPAATFASSGVHGYVGPTISTPMPASLLRKAPRTGLS